MRLLLLVPLLAVAALAGCADDDATAPVGPAATTSPVITSPVTTTRVTTTPLTTTPRTTGPVTTTPVTTSPVTTSPVTTSPVTTTPVGCPTAGPTRGRIDASIEFGGEDRAYVLYVPGGFDASSPAAVVLNFHGLGSSGAQQFAYADFTGEAESAGFLIVAPDGTGEPRRWPFAGFDPGADARDSVAFVDALLARLDTEYCLDHDRIYATGMSYGGVMSSALGCLASDRIAAVAPVAATFHLPACEAAGPVDLLAFHGDADEVVHFDGSPSAVDPTGALGDIGANVAAWAAQAGCAPDPGIESVAPDVERREWDCDDAEVGLYVVLGGGHTWPGARDIGLLGTTTHSIDASALIWEFFSRHRLGDEGAR